MKKSVGGTESVVQIGSSDAATSDILKEYIYVATNNQTTFSGSDANSQTLSYQVGALNVYQNGVLLKPTTDYTASNGTSVVLVNGATTSDDIQIVTWWKTIGKGDDVVQALGDGNGSTTSYTLGTDPIDENQTLVFLDGIYQSKSNYSISGTTLTFSTAPPSGVAIEVVTHVGNFTTEQINNLTATGTITANAFSGNITGNVTGNLTGNVTGTVSSLNNLDTDNLSEGSSNLYYTDARVSTRTDTILNHSNHSNISVSKVGNELRLSAASSYGNSDVETYLDTNGLTLPNNIAAYFGANNALQLYHNGSHSLISNQVGNLYLRNQTNDGDIIIQADDGSGGDATYITVDGSAETTVFHKNSRHADNALIQVGDGNDAAWYHNSSDNSTYFTNSTGHLKFRQFADDSDIVFDCDDGSGGVERYLTLDGSTKFIQFDQHSKITDTNRIDFGNASDLRIYHTDPNSYVYNYTGDLIIRNDADDIKILAEDDVVIRDNDDSTEMAKFINGGAVELYHNGSKKFETAADGIDVTGHIDSATLTTTGNVTVGGNLTVSGTTTTLNSTTLEVADLNIVVGKNATTSSAANGAGITFGAWSSGTTPRFEWDHTNSRFFANKPITANIVGNVTGNITGTVLTAAQGNITSLGTLTSLGVNGDITLSSFGDELLFGSSSNKLGYAQWLMSASGGGLIKNVSGPLTLNPDDYTAFQVNDVEVARINASGLTVVGDITLGSKIMHDGDTDNYIRFPSADTQSFVTGNSTRFQITNSLVRFNQENNNQDFAVFSSNSDHMLYVDASADKVGIGTATPGVSLDIASRTDAIRVPNGTTAQRPTAAVGQLRYNTTTSQFEGYTGSWGAIGGGGDAFGTIAVSGQSNVVADQENDTLTLVAGTGMTITTAAGSDTITLSADTSVSPFSTDLFTSNANQTAYTLSVTPVGEDHLIVFIEGVYQNKNSYTLSGTSLTLDSAPTTGSEVVVHAIGAGIVGTGHNQDSFTGNGSTAAYTLSVAPISEDNCFVFADGVYQNKSTFSVSGTTLTFDANVPNGVVIEVITPSLTEIGVPTAGSVSPNKLSTGGPTWDAYGNVTINSNVVKGSESTTISSGSATAVATIGGSAYRSVKITAQVTDSSASEYMVSEILLIHTGSATHITEYGQIHTGSSPLGTFTADYSSGNMRLLYTRTGSNSQVVKVDISRLKV